MKPTYFLSIFIILLLTACAPAAPMTTATPLPPTLTATSEPTMTPTPQPTQTSTPEPSLTATNTEEPTLIPTSAPTELPTQQSIEIMMNREGVTGKLYEARYYTSEESQNLIYNAPLFDGEDIYSYYKPTMRPAPKGYGLLFTRIPRLKFIANIFTIKR